MSRSPLTRLWLLVGVFLVSTAGLFAHRALAEATPLAIAAWRLGLASLFFLGLSGSGRSGTPIVPLTRPTRLRLTLAGLCLAAHFVTWFLALDRTPVARATLLACTTPLWTTLTDLLPGRPRPTPAAVLALVFAGVGLWLVTGTSSQAPTPATLAGDLFGLSAGLLFALYFLCVEGLHVTVSAQRQVTATYSVAAAVLWAAFLLRGGVTLGYSPGVWRALLGMTLGPQILGHTLLNWSLRHFPASTVAFAILLEPILASLLAWALFGQTVTAGQMLGGLLVLVAIGFVIGRQPTGDRLADGAAG